MGWHGIDAQQSMERIPAISGPTQPPRLAKRSAHSNRMGFAIFITGNDTTPRKTTYCEIDQAP